MVKDIYEDHAENPKGALFAQTSEWAKRDHGGPEPTEPVEFLGEYPEAQAVQQGIDESGVGGEGVEPGERRNHGDDRVRDQHDGAQQPAAENDLGHCQGDQEHEDEYYLSSY